MPPKETNIGILANAVARLEARPLPAHSTAYFKSLRYIGSALPFYMRMVVANAWLFAPLLKWLVLRKARTAPQLRTTTAITIIKGGHKINTVPAIAEAWVNHRVHPGDSDLEQVLAMDRAIIADGRVKLSVSGFGSRSENNRSYKGQSEWLPVAPVSPLDTRAFAWIKRSVAEVLGVPTAPLLMTGNTDTRHYWGLTSNIYRFSPIVMHVDQLAMFHGKDERISLSNLAGLHDFYERLMLNVDEGV